MQQIKERGALPCIDRGDIRLIDRLIVVISVRQSTVAAISGLHCRALVIAVRLTAGQNSKKRLNGSERAEIEIQRAEAERSALMYEQSYRDYLRSGYLHHRHLSWAVNLLIITVITPLPTKPSATKMPEN